MNVHQLVSQTIIEPSWNYILQWEILIQVYLYQKFETSTKITNLWLFWEWHYSPAEYGHQTLPKVTIFRFTVRLHKSTMFDITLTIWNILNRWASDDSVLLDGFSTANGKWIDSTGAELNFTNWGIAHPVQRNYVSIIMLK